MQTVSFQAPEEMNKALELFAKEFDRSKAYLIRQAVAEYLEDLADVKKALRTKRTYKPSETYSLEEMKRRHKLN